MRSSDLGIRLAQALLAGVLCATVLGCAQHAPDQLALRDRIEQGALTPEDSQRFYTSERQQQAAVASANDPVGRLASGLDQQLIRAASRADVGAVRQLLKEGAQVNAVEERGNTALLLAAREGDVETARALLRAGADVDGRAGPLTPLGQAALRGHSHMVRLLLRTGARVDAAGLNEHTPLMNAVKLNHPEVVSLLLKAGANTQVKDRTGAGLLLVAINDNLPGVMAVLLGQGLDPNQPDADGLTPLYWANQLKREALAAQLVQAGAQDGLKRQVLRASRPYPKEDF